jgi:hypothetical protein
VQGCFYRWRDNGPWARINHHLLLAPSVVIGLPMDAHQLAARRW